MCAQGLPRNNAASLAQPHEGLLTHYHGYCAAGATNQQHQQASFPNWASHHNKLRQHTNLLPTPCQATSKIWATTLCLTTLKDLPAAYLTICFTCGQWVRFLEIAKAAYLDGLQPVHPQAGFLGRLGNTNKQHTFKPGFAEKAPLLLPR